MTPSIILTERTCVFANLMPFVAYDRSIHLGLLKVDRVPPHLVLTVGAKYFSLEKDRCVRNGDLPHLLRLLGRNGTRCVFVPLPLLPLADAVQGANRAFHPFSAASADVTCVRPIANFMAGAYGWGTEGAGTVFDLLQVISSKAMPGHVSGRGVDAPGIEIPRYSGEEVSAYIHGL